VIGNVIAQFILARESRMNKRVADVETMFSAIADSIYKAQLPELES
jgi:hypothetical protein